MSGPQSPAFESGRSKNPLLDISFLYSAGHRRWRRFSPFDAESPMRTDAADLREYFLGEASGSTFPINEGMRRGGASAQEGDGRGGGFIGSTTAHGIDDGLADVVLTGILDGVPAGKALDMAGSGRSWVRTVAPRGRIFPVPARTDIPNSAHGLRLDSKLEYPENAMFWVERRFRRSFRWNLSGDLRSMRWRATNTTC